MWPFKKRPKPEPVDHTTCNVLIANLTRDNKELAENYARRTTLSNHLAKELDALRGENIRLGHDLAAARLELAKSRDAQAARKIAEIEAPETFGGRPGCE